MTKEKNNIYLFVDGTNLYVAQYELFGPDKYLDFGEFILTIEENMHVQFSKIFFYASFSPKPKNSTLKQIQYLKNEGLFYKSVMKTKRITFFKGYRSKTSGKEKEVDVNLAVDVVHYAHKNKFYQCYILSGDADFMHALEITRSLRKKVEIIALENRIPYRFSFLFQTYVITFFINKKLTFHIKQKIKKMAVDKNRMVKQV